MSKLDLAALAGGTKALADDLVDIHGDAIRFSHSSWEKLDACARKWYYGQVMRAEGTKSERASDGTMVHEYAEYYLTTGEWPWQEGDRFAKCLAAIKDHPEAAEAGWPEVPPGGLDVYPNGDYLVEYEATNTIGEFPAIFKMDLGSITKDTDGKVRVRIDDIKTTGSKGWRYIKLPEDLAMAQQPHLYVWGVVTQLLSEGILDAPPDEVDVAHYNVRVLGDAEAMPVWTTVKWTDVLDTIERAEKAAKRMATLIRTFKDPNQVPGNKSACRDFGGCPYTECPLNPKNPAAGDGAKLAAKHIKSLPKKEQSDIMSNQNSARAKLLAAMGVTSNDAAPPARAVANAAPAITDSALSSQALQLIDAMGGQAPTSAISAMLAGRDLNEFLSANGLVEDAGYIRRCNAGEDAGAEDLPSFEDMMETVSEPTSYGGTISPGHPAHAPKAQPTAAPEPRVTHVTLTDEERVAEFNVELRLSLCGDTEARVGWNSLRDLWAKHTGKRRLRRDSLAKALESDLVFDEESSCVRIRTVSAPVEEQTREAQTIDPEPQPETVSKGWAPVDDPTWKAKSAIETVETEVADEVVPLLEARLAGWTAKTTTIYVDCQPARVDIPDMAEFFAQAEQVVEAAHNVDHYGLIPYAQGAKEVMGVMKSGLEAGGPEAIGAEVYLSSRHPLADEFLALASRFSFIKTVIPRYR
jgi:hypothetical protein